nr:hypothetical protein [uncultured Cohaesibacter sp.]
MSDDKKVVSLNGGPVPQAGEVNNHVMTVLDELMSAAQSGDLQGIAVIGCNADGTRGRYMAGERGGFGTIGALQVMVCQLSAEAMEE